MKKSILKTAALFMCCTLLCSLFPNINLKAEAVSSEILNFSEIENTDNGYSQYYNSVKTASVAKNNIDISLQSFDIEQGEAVVDASIVSWKDGDGKISWNFTAGDEGLYTLQITYKVAESGVNPRLGIMIDGLYPFEEARSVVLEKLWENVSKEPRTDKSGNEYAQEQQAIDGFITDTVSDDTGIVVEPYCFYLTEGKHTLSFVDCGQKIEVSKISFTVPEATVAYKALSDSYKLSKTSDKIIYIQGEKANVKTRNTLIPKTDNSNAGMTPSSPYATKLNYIGGSSWNVAGDRIEWNFDVETSGYYSIGFRFKQSELVNGDSLRWLKIDGKTPFTEAKTIKFGYNAGWKNKQYSNSKNEPYYIYLEAGTHTVSMEATLGDLAEYCNRLSDIINQLADIYVQVVMITGETPDISRDYELFKQIPGLNDNLDNCSKLLIALATDMKADLAEQGNQYTAAMDNMVRTITNMIEKPYIAQQFVSDYYSNYTSLSSWLYDMQKMPLCIDEIQFVPYGAEVDFDEPNIFEKLLFSIKRLFASFVKDYGTLDSDEPVEEIRIWINWGQDQAGVLSSLIEDSFTPKTNIEVKLELVSASLINGLLSGNFPDLVMRMNRTQPVDFAMRGALYDLTEFEDCDEVLTRFQENAELPYRYKDGLYALPDTQTFYVMYTRDDILAQLGLETPKTWDEFLHVATIIQRNNMNVYIPYAAPATTSGVGMLHLLPTLLVQNNLSVYNEQRNATAFGSEEFLNVFSSWIDLYSDYGIQKEADFYNRFRTGLIPLGICSYDTYKTIYAAAPEIAGRWSISTVPATNGNYSVAGSGTGCGIINKSEHKKAAWEYLKWWTSASTQIRFSNNIESILGTIGRVDTANVEAFRSLSWDPDDLEVLMEQWNNVVEIPEVPGGYYVMRAIDQAYWEVMNGTSHDGDAVDKWRIVADNEIKRKIKEYE